MTITIVVRTFLSVLMAWLTAMTASDVPRIHVVTRGDSLSELAERYRVDIDELRTWNDLEDDTIRIGQELTLDGPAGRSGRTHRVRAGETLTRIARMYGVSVERIVAHNPDLDVDRVREGAELAIGAPDPSESIGEPGAGSIRGGQRLSPHDAFIVRDPARSYATHRTIERLREGFDVLLRLEPRAPRVRVHDLSLEGGGPMDDHHTHQSGRDVDMTYFQREGCGPEGCPLRAITAEQLDARREWRLLHHWLTRDEVEVIYVDHALQAALHREARRQGATDAQLAEWFQYPRSASAAVGRIRHFPNHVDHVHVRFACDRDERRCTPSTHGP